MSITLHGVGVAEGIAIGHAHLVAPNKVDVVHYVIPEHLISFELIRFDTAIKETRKELEMLWGSIPENAPAELGAFLNLHIMMLRDHTLSIDPKKIIEQQNCNAEWALKVQKDTLLAQFDEIEESYLRERRADLIQVVDRIFSALSGQTNGPNLPEDPERDFILVAHDLSPADMIHFKDIRFAAFMTDIGGTTSHTAILARSLAIPSVLALHNASQIILNNELIIVDGTQGVIIIDPDERILAEYRQRQIAWQQDRKDLSSLTTTVAATIDGTPVDLFANIELPSDVDLVKANGALGVGLFRSEFLFLGRDTLPDENEQFEAYKRVIESMNGQPVVIRTLDLGADKNPKWANHGFSANPALGLGGVRLCLAEPNIFIPQLRALLRASNYGNLQILVPMLSNINELHQVITHIEQAKNSLFLEQISFNEEVKIGGMIEIPSAALTVDSFVKRLDFLSIGTNDLIQYTLAIDRTDDRVTHLYDPLNPAVLKLIQMTISAADQAGIPVSVCGEMAGDAKLTRVLLGLGLRRFSMHPAHLLSVKRVILQSDLSQCFAKTKDIIAAESSEERDQLLLELNTDSL